MLRSLPVWGFPVWGLLASACSPAPEAPRVDAIAPDWGWHGEATDVEVSGSGFYPQVIVGGPDEGEVDAGFRVYIELPSPVALSAVDPIDYHTLAAEVPEDLPVGRYPVLVVTPGGLEARLADAFSVTDTRADHLSLTVTSAAYDVNETAFLSLRLEDPDDFAVATPMKVRLEARSDTGAAGILILGGLADASFLTEGVGIEGLLGADGEATVLVTSTTPDDVTFTLSAVDDPVVDPDEDVVSWEPGLLDHIEILLPEPGFTATAGEAFDVDVKLYDRNGNDIGAQPLTLVLSDTCGSTPTALDLAREGPFPVTLTAACDADQLVGYGNGIEGRSESFTVSAGPAAAYAVSTYPTTVTAGMDSVFVFVDAIDAWDNLVPEHAATLSLTDNVGGLNPALGIGAVACGGFEGGRALCSATLQVADPAVAITVQDERDLFGVSDTFVVLPGPVADLGVVVESEAFVAGQVFVVSVTAVDEWGNDVEFDAGGADPVAFSDDTGTIACSWTGATGAVQAHDCTVTLATAGTRVRGEVFGLLGETATAVPVVNGILAYVEVEPTGTSFTAGVPFGTNFRGWDAWGNVYSWPTSGVGVDISDTTGTVNPPSVSFDTAGEAALVATITGSGTDVRIFASQAEVVLGTSREITVVPAAMAGFSIEVDPWIDGDLGSDVLVAAVDPYGNRISGYVGTVTLTAEDGRCDTLSVSGFSGGEQQGTLTCTDPGLQEVLHGVDAFGYSGESAGFDVLDFGCEDGPTAAIALNGAVEATACLLAGVATVEADASGSVAGAEPIAIWHFDDTEGALRRTVVAAQDFTYDTSGVRTIQAVVSDSYGCASQASGVVAVGEDDGSATGTISVVSSASSVATGGSVSVDIGATDCAGDVATAAEVFVRADLGEVAGSATGEGLVVALDSNGAGTVDWSFPEDFAATATFYTGSGSGSGSGSASVAVTADSVRPMVALWTPAGTWVDAVDAISVTFTDPMLAISFSTSSVTLTGPAGEMDTTTTLAADLDVATITPDIPIDPADGAWTLTLADQVRDTAGNRLSGDWSGGAADWSGTFGAVVGSMPGALGCSASGRTLTPDGDPGAGDEADEITLAVSADASPEAWWLDVSDGTRVRTVHADGGATELAWDGRGDDGVVVEAGEYVLVVSAEDDAGNRAVACTVDVAVRHLVDAP